MENYQISRPCGRPYNATCGMAKEMMSGQQCSCRNNSRNQPSRPSPCPCHLPDAKTRDAEMYTHIDQMEAAMAYVPCQKFTTTYDLGYALKVGTVFPQLCKPFCGKRGVRFERGKIKKDCNIQSLCSCGSRIRTDDLWVMSPTSYHCSTPRCL